MDTELDYKAIAEGLQLELEQARLNILRLRQQRTLHLDASSVRVFIRDNYVVIAGVSLILFVLLNLISLVKDFFTTKE